MKIDALQLMTVTGVTLVFAAMLASSTAVAQQDTRPQDAIPAEQPRANESPAPEARRDYAGRFTEPGADGERASGPAEQRPPATRELGVPSSAFQREVDDPGRRTDDAGGSRAVDGAGEPGAGPPGAGTHVATAVRHLAAPRIVLLPVELLAGAEASSSGCWVRLYGKRDYGGDAFVILGPSDVADFSRFAPQMWGSIDSVAVGPSARVTTFDGRDFSNPRAELEPGGRVADLHGEKLGPQGSIASLRVECTQVPATGD